VKLIQQWAVSLCVGALDSMVCEMAQELDRAKLYRNRAEELRTLADSTRSPEVRTELENWAQECERVAVALATVKSAQISN